MNRASLRTFLAKVQELKPSNAMSIYFVRKMSSDNYMSFQPQVANTVQQQILAMVIPYLLKQLDESVITDYNPIGVADGEIESLSVDSVSSWNAFAESIKIENTKREMQNLTISAINFYCIKIELEGSYVLLLRQFSKLKKLRSGYLARFVNDELVAMEGDFLGIDEASDIIAFEDELCIINHISLERILSYRDKYLAKTNEAMGELLSQDIISNLEQFHDDCCRDVRIMKRFTNIMSNGRLPLFFDNFDKVPDIVTQLGLDIEFEDGKLVYREKSQLFHIINFMSDSYFKSLLADRMGIAKMEEPLNADQRS